MTEPNLDRDPARLQAALAAANARADAAVRAREAFLLKLSHDLRNPLGAIAAATEVLHRISGQQPDEVRARDVIRRQLQQLTRIVDDLLDTDRMLNGTVTLARAPLDLAAAAAAALAALQSQGRLRDHEVERDLAPVWVHADRDRMIVAVSHLVANAVKHSPPGARIGVRVARASGDASLVVSDAGDGIAPARLASIFEPFQHDDDKPRHGFGAGLAIVRSLVELHGGRIEATSAGPGQGSRFELRLPRIEPPTA